MKKIIYTLGVLCSSSLAFAQINGQISDSSNLKMLWDIGDFASTKMCLEPKHYFYKNWSKNENPSVYLYASNKESLTSPFSDWKGFGNSTHDSIITQTKKSYDDRGLETMVYKTYGTAGTELTHHLLNYNKPSVMFIGFHEATHQKITGNIFIPYAYVEALCDLMATQGIQAYTKARMPELYTNHQNFCLKIEALNSCINKCILSIESNDANLKKHFKKLRKEVANIDPSDQFMVERYNYVINNAYLLRYRSYTKYYFQLKELLLLQNDYDTFWTFIKKMPNDEALIEQIINAEILKLKSR